MVEIIRWCTKKDSCGVNIDMLKSISVPEPMKTLLEREFSRWESIIIDGVQESLQDIKSSLGESFNCSRST